MDDRTCKTCTYWRGGECEGVDFEYDRRAKNDGRTAFVVVADAADDTDLCARLMTGPDFGCNKHTPRGDR